MKKIKSGFIGRQIFAAKTLFKILPDLLPTKFKGPEQLIKKILGDNIQPFIDEVSSLKGPALKAAQMLTIYGEYYLPKEVNEILKQIQANSFYLDWHSLKKDIPEAILLKFEIDESPMAAASIGQVHKAKNKLTGEIVAIKIQYPKIDKAIDIDLNILKRLLSLLRILPGNLNLSKIFEEIKNKLIDEMNYKEEAKNQHEYKLAAKDLTGVYVPQVFLKDCTSKILVQEYIHGVLLSSEKVLERDQDYRNKIGIKIFQLFFHEIYVMGLVQSDAHAGNYLVIEKEVGEATVVLVDFGACVHYSKKTLRPYLELIESVFNNDKFKYTKTFAKIEKESQGQYQIDRDLLFDYFKLCVSPLHSSDFDWGQTSLPDQVYQLGISIFKNSKIDNPPYQYIFIDRKIAGVFSLLKMLRARFDVLAVVSPYFIKD